MDKDGENDKKTAEFKVTFNDVVDAYTSSRVRSSASGGSARFFADRRAFHREKLHEMIDEYFDSEENAQPALASTSMNTSGNSSSGNQVLTRAQEEIESARDSAQRQLATALANGFGALSNLSPRALNASVNLTVNRNGKRTTRFPSKLSTPKRTRAETMEAAAEERDVDERPNKILNMFLNTKTIPLQQRMRLRAVSRRWLPVLEDGLARETALVIRDKEGICPTSKPDDLVVEGGILTEEIIRTLSRLFPSPTELSIAFGKWECPSVSWSTVPSLLTQMGTNLTTVKLYGYIDEAATEPLSSALAHLPVLTSLTLSGFGLGDSLLPHLGPVLSRLETFVYPHEGILPKSASSIASSLSPRCTRLLLHQDDFNSFPAPFLSQLSASLMHLSLVWCKLTTVSESISQMHGLPSLTLDFHDMEMKWTELDSFLFRELSPLARLTDLKLFGLTFDGIFTLALPSKKPLSTIERLTLEVWSADEDSLIDFHGFFKYIATRFPALTKLTLITDEVEFPGIQACLGKLSFPVEIVDRGDFEYLNIFEAIYQDF